MARTVYLHVGTAKSGTTYVQHILLRNRQLLEGHGLLYPGRRPRAHFLGSMDLRGSGFKGHTYPGAEGAWDRLVEQTNRFDGNALISHETLAMSPPEVMQKAVGSFPGRDVRVILTCRDLGRQIPAVWQERVKNRSHQTYAAYLQRVFDAWNGGNPAPRGTFWDLQNLIELTRRWSGAVGAENVRLVTVPAPGADRDELWKRFARGADLPDVDYDLDAPASNASLGTAETELLRRLNQHFRKDLTWPQYSARIKGRFVLQELSQRSTSGSLTVPVRWRESTEQVANQMIEFLRGSGCDVVGDLEELRPHFRTEASLPDEVGADELLGLALDLLASLTSRIDPSAERPKSGRADLSGREAARVIVARVKDRLRFSR